ncbi:acyl-CoA dehydrogenase [Neptunicella marina]|uniref:Acyl-CoA dehydrogenase n=1 Tax=Neptunicella marina TaxID=2125989 RepID=A0A8J6M0D9_9ALTE|nr:acyl-CoA dehydrogenase [Neptunicella marina]MBC3764633.1 acyl-CoA dehydrogenase [Neptunicella marina]
MTPLPSFSENTLFSEPLLNWIAQCNLWNLWVPKNYGGLETGFLTGLQQLQTLARTDSSLGWTVTLCAGANYFVGNLLPQTADQIFAGGKAILGGSGGMFGTAEKLDNHYKLNGTWRYATGAPYLTHFTLNAQITENGQALTHADGSPQFLSFVIPASEVDIIQDWNTMGLKASATHSFSVSNLLVNQEASFSYNHCHLPQAIFRIPFSLFADLTLWVNYLGMAEHFVAEAQDVLPTESAQGLLAELQAAITQANQQIIDFATLTSERVENAREPASAFCDKVHQSACDSVKCFSQQIVTIFPHLGVKAAREEHILNQIFRDYFTASQHHIFSDMV